MTLYRNARSTKHEIPSLLVTEIQLHNLLSPPLPALYFTYGSHRTPFPKWRFFHIKMKLQMEIRVMPYTMQAFWHWNQTPLTHLFQMVYKLKTGTKNWARTADQGTQSVAQHLLWHIWQHRSGNIQHMTQNIHQIQSSSLLLTLKFKHWWQNYWCHLSYRWMESMNCIKIYIFLTSAMNNEWSLMRQLCTIIIWNTASSKNYLVSVSLMIQFCYACISFKYDIFS